MRSAGKPTMLHSIRLCRLRAHIGWYERCLGSLAAIESLAADGGLEAALEPWRSLGKAVSDALEEIDPA